MALRDRLFGDVDTLTGAALARAARHGSEALEVRCLRSAAARTLPDAAELALPRLERPEAGVRRAAAWALGMMGSPGHLGALRAATARERTDEGLLALVVARIRCGEPAEHALALLRSHEERAFRTPTGPRRPAAVIDDAPLVDRARACVGPFSVLRTERRAAGDVLALARLGHPDDFAGFLARLPSAGRRGEHTLLLALGLTGDPRAAVPLREALRATDVDPGRGFAHRRIAATGLGRLGLWHTSPWLIRALEDEAHDYEGRPGAGLGIQYPVRTNLLWALGEVGDPNAIPALVRHLGDTSGSALGGFALPAMDALWKLGPTAVPALERAARGTDVAAEHARAVLEAMNG